MTSNSWVTLATNDSYSLGALVLAHSLRRVDTAHQLTILVTPGVSSPMRNQLSAAFDVVEEVNVLDSRDEKNLALLTRPELGITFTKLHCWRLTQFAKCVFVDADVLVLQNCDELFEREELSAAPDVGWPDCFNSGVFVYQPSIDTYNAIINFALSKGSFDGGDQGLLNQFFSDWATRDISRHLPFIYNMCSTATYSYLPAFKQFGKDVKVVHFIGPAKPWLQYLDSQTRQVTPSSGSEHLQELLQLWWDIFCHHVHSSLSSDMAGLAGAFAQLTLGEARSAEQVALEEHLRKQAWEHGSIDYMGRDSFDNIWRKICQTLAQTPQDQGASDSSETLTGPVATESEAESTPTPALAESLPTPASQMNETIPSSNIVSQTSDELPNSSQEAQRDVLQLSQAVSSAEQDVGTIQAASAVVAAVGSGENVQAAVPATVPSEELVAAAADTHAPIIVSTDSSDVVTALSAAQSANAVSIVPASPTVSTLSADATHTPQTSVTVSSQSVATIITMATTIEPTLTVTTTPVTPPSVVLTPRAKVLEAVLAEYTRDVPSQPSGVEFKEPQMEEPQVVEAGGPQTLESPELAEQTKSSGGLPGNLQNPEVKSTSSVASSDNFEYESVESVESGSSKSLPANDILPTDSSRCVPISVQASSVETKNEDKAGGTSVSAQPNPKLVSGGPTPSPNPVVVTAYVKQMPGVTIPPQSQFAAPPKAHASQTTCSTDQATAVASSTKSSDLKGAVQITGSSQSLIVTEPTPPTSPESASTSPLPVAISPQALQVESDIPATPPVGVPSATAPDTASTQVPAPIPISTSEALALTPVQSTETATATGVTEAAAAAAATSEEEAQHEPSVSQELPSTGQYDPGAPVPPKRNKKPGGKSAKNVKPQSGKK